MLNKFAKLLLVLTSLAPIALTIGVNRWSQHADWISASVSAGVGIVLVALCLGILRHAKNNSQIQRVHIASFERDNRSAIDFLVVYLLPLINTKNIGYDGDIVTSAFVVALIIIVFMHKGTFEFNPGARVMRISLLYYPNRRRVFVGAHQSQRITQTQNSITDG
jgi:hypothetical protein